MPPDSPAPAVLVGMASLPSLILALTAGSALSAAVTFWQPGVRVVDGDTVHPGFWTYRLDGLDTPEIRGAKCPSEREAAHRAQERLRDLTDGHPVRLRPSGRRDRYGRWLAMLEADGRDVGSILILEGLARPYKGGARGDWCLSQAHETGHPQSGR